MKQMYLLIYDLELGLESWTFCYRDIATKSTTISRYCHCSLVPDVGASAGTAGRHQAHET